MILIEFNGLPGSGKTTTMKQLQNGLELQGLRVDTLTSALMKLGKARRVFYKALYGRNSFDGISSIVNANRLDSDQCRRSIQAIDRIYKEYMAIIHGCKGLDICLIDQGLLQGILSVFHDKNIVEVDGISAFFHDVHQKFPNLIEINGQSPVELAVERIVNRHQQGVNAGRLDKLSGESLVSCMKIQAGNLNILREAAMQYIECIDVDLTKQPMDNSKTLINELWKREPV